MEVTGIKSRPDHEDGELYSRVIKGLVDELAAFGSGAPDSRVIRREGILATVAPSVPDRSLFNSVCYRDADALAAMLDELEAIYTEAGIRAWTVWVEERDRTTAGLLASRGHVLDAAPRAMALWLDELAPEPAGPEGVTTASGDPRTAATLNDLAYGYDTPVFRAALSGQTDPPLRWTIAVGDGEPLHASPRSMSAKTVASPGSRQLPSTKAGASQAGSSTQLCSTPAAAACARQLSRPPKPEPAPTAASASRISAASRCGSEGSSFEVLANR